MVERKYLKQVIYAIRLYRLIFQIEFCLQFSSNDLLRESTESCFHIWVTWFNKRRLPI